MRKIFRLNLYPQCETVGDYIVPQGCAATRTTFIPTVVRAYVCSVDGVLLLLFQSTELHICSLHSKLCTDTWNAGHFPPLRTYKAIILLVVFNGFPFFQDINDVKVRIVLFYIYIFHFIRLVLMKVMLGLFWQIDKV